MAVDFSESRWDRVRETYGKWWAGELDRPLVFAEVSGKEPGRPEPDLPAYPFTSFYDLSVPVEAIVDRWDYDLSCRRFLGDAFPHCWPNFGPGVAAAFFGADLRAERDTTWFQPSEEQEIEDIHLAFDPDNIWVRRIADLCRAAMERWEGRVQVAMTDLGGTLDILSTFRPGEKLLLDLYDKPEEVRRLTWEIHEGWFRAFEALDAVLQPRNPGYTAWTSIFSAEPYYMLQCDFCYMIGPEMFDAFVKPELAAACSRLTHPFYHLDGSGQLPHLDSLLEIESLKGVQWVPGDGARPYTEWPDVYRKIHAAGKRIQLWGDERTLATLRKQLGDLRGVILIAYLHAEEEARAGRWLAEYGAA